MAVQTISKELSAGQMAQLLGMPEGMPTHIGTPAGQPQPAGPPGSQPVPGAHIGMDQASRQAQGSQPGQVSANGGPQLANSVSNTPGPGAKLSPGPG